MKKQTSITNFLILFVILMSFPFYFNKAKADTPGCCVDGNTCMPASDLTDCPSGVGYSTVSCNSLSECTNIVTNLPNSTNTNQSTTGTTNSTGLGNSTSSGNTATPAQFTIPTGFGLPDPVGGITAIIKNLLSWLLGLVGVIAIIAFAISGMQYLMASGNEKIAEIAKRNMTYSIFGVIVALSGMVIIRALDAALRAWTLF